MKTALDIERLRNGYRGWIVQRQGVGIDETMVVLTVVEAGSLDALHDILDDDRLRALDVRWVVDGRRRWVAVGGTNAFETAESYITPAAWRAESGGEAA